MAGDHGGRLIGPLIKTTSFIRGLSSHNTSSAAMRYHQKVRIVITFPTVFNIVETCLHSVISNIQNYINKNSTKIDVNKLLESIKFTINVPKMKAGICCPFFLHSVL